MEYYRGLLAQRGRIDAFQKRLGEIVRPGDRVLEIGAGLGTYSFFAAQAGAGKVWGIEGAPVINVARAIARENGFADRVEFIRGWFPGITIPEPIDVLIFEDYPARLIDQWTYGVLERLHQNVLKPGARVVPDRARMFLVPVECERNWQIVGPFTGDDDAAYGVDWSTSRSYIYNTPLQMPLEPSQFCQTPQTIGDIDLSNLPNVSDLQGSAQWTFEEDATIHGLAYWFALEVGDDVWLTNEPGGEPGSWGYLYLPVASPMKLQAGDTLAASVGPDVNASGAPMWLTWELRSPHERFCGHEFRSFPASLSDLVRGSPSWVPELSEETKVEQAVLGLADGARTVDDIAKEISGLGIASSEEEAQTLVLGVLEGKTARSPRTARTSGT